MDYFPSEPLEFGCVITHCYISYFVVFCDLYGVIFIERTPFAHVVDLYQ